MANITANKSGNPVMFKSIDETPIRSLKAHFAPVQAGSGDPSPSNARPITGWTGANVVYAENSKPIIFKNFQNVVDEHYSITMDENKNIRFINDGSGPISFYSDIQTVTLKKDVTYNLNIGSNIKDLPSSNMVFRFVDANNNNLVAMQIAPFDNSVSDIGASITPPYDIVSSRIRIQMVRSISDITIKPFILELDEHAYHDTLINWQSTDTVYGGYVDLISGEVVRNTNYRVLNGTDDNTSSQYTNYGNYSPLGFGDIFGAGRRFTVSVDNAIDSIICDSLPIYTDTTSENFPYLYVMQQGNFIYYLVIMGKPSEHPEITNSTTAIQYTSNWLKEHPVTVVWKTAPYTVTTLTPTQLSTFRGDNTIWSSANDTVEVEYDLHEAGDIAAIRRRVNQSAPHLVTSTPADIATFNTDLAAPVKELRCEFLPVQEGSGDPSPENVRAITGWTGLNVFAAPPKRLIFPSSYQEFTQNGATIKCYPSGEFVVEGVATDTVYFDMDINPVQLDFQNENIDSFYVGFKTKYNIYNFIINLRDDNGSIMSVSPAWSNYYGQMRANQMEEVKMPRVATILRFIIGSGVGNITSIPFFTKESLINTASISWQSEAGTVYGGYVDLVKGEVVAEYELKTYDSSTGWDYVGKFTTFDGWSTDLDSKHQVSQTIICNYLKGLQPGGISKMKLYETRLNTACTMLMISLDSGVNTSESLNNYLSQNPLQIVFKLAAPIHTPITPVILNTLKGTNNVWSAANGPVTIKYWKH